MRKAFGLAWLRQYDAVQYQFADRRRVRHVEDVNGPYIYLAAGCSNVGL